MPLTCSICRQPDRTAIEREIIRGIALREIAGRFPGTSRTALGRHKLDHLGAALLKAREKRELTSGNKVLAEVEAIAGKTIQLYDSGASMCNVAATAWHSDPGRWKAAFVHWKMAVCGNLVPP